MAGIKVYLKRANSQKERKLQRALQEFVTKQQSQDSSFKFEPAKDLNELQRAFDKYCIQDVDFKEIPNKSSKSYSSDDNSDYDSDSHNSDDSGPDDGLGEETSSTSGSESDEIPQEIIDPFNRSEPIVRDYVTKDDFASTNPSNNTGPQQTTFNEPTSFSESFEMPGDESGNSSSSTSKSPGQGPNKKPEQKTNPVNPQWDEMAANKKRKSTRKFAKYIVEVVCMLSEKGFVWYANKDINEAKLAEYELNDEIDLTLLITLEDGQAATVKQFFLTQCAKAEQMSKIDPQEKEDLSDALAEVLLEKGAGPTPTQELILISIKIFGGQAITLFALKSQSNAILNQLKAMKQGETEDQDPHVEPKREYQEPHHTQPAQRNETQAELKKELVIERDYTNMTSDESDQLQIGESKETKE